MERNPGSDAGRWLLVSVVCCFAVGLDAEEERPFRSRVRFRPQASEADTPVDRLRLGWNSEAEADWPAADVLALISEWAYLSPDDAQPKFRDLGFERVQPFAEDNSSGYVVSADDVVVIAFCGTQDLAGWIINLDVLSHTTPHGNIHAGYYKAYRSMKPQILARLKEAGARKIWITGHSLGGALAVACAYDLIAQENIRLHGLMTYGQPMVADKDLANYLNQRLVGRYAHIVNGLDIVPRLPPGYAHGGSLVWFTGGEVLRSPKKRPLTRAELGNSPTARRDPIEPLSDDEFADLKAKLQRSGEPRSVIHPAAFSSNTPLWIQDHSLPRYRKQIQRVAEKVDVP